MIKALQIGVFLYATASMAFAQVGMRELNIDGLSVTMVYPTDAKSQTMSFGAFQLDVAQGASPKQGNNRLVVLSHGTGGSSQSDHQIASTLAKAGYIVAQPLHTGDNWKDVSKAGPESWKTRPLEISKVIDALSKDSLWNPLFDAHQVGVHGMSAGGATALTVAGAQWNMLTMIRHCGKNMDEDIGFCLNGLANDKLGQIKRRSQYTLAASTPESYLPKELKTNIGSPEDKRIKAITVTVPVAAIFTTESLARLRIPVGVVSAANDELLLPTFHSNYLLANCNNCTLLMKLNNASHFDLLGPWPASTAQSVGALQVRGGYPNPAFDPADRAKAFGLITAFFNQNLK
ncbi:MAG: dienelactone hydrolase family protein [Cytophagales bacterium]|nr:dienelactone hydrolase family protein [Cytophagales bacterium]